MGDVVCSCGIDGCKETGWPHEWNPVEAGDECGLGVHMYFRVFTIDQKDPFLSAAELDHDEPSLEQRHRVRTPYVKWGSGYVCKVCAEAASH